MIAESRSEIMKRATSLRGARLLAAIKTSISSGRVVFKYAYKFKIKPEHVLVVYDDIDLPLGMIKIKLKGSSGGHNGIGSVIESFRTDAIPRIKVGINAGYKPADLSEYVLSDFQSDELTRAESAIEQAVLECESWIYKN